MRPGSRPRSRAIASFAQRFELVREELGETIRLNEDLGAPSSRALKALFEKIDRGSAASAGGVVRSAGRDFQLYRKLLAAHAGLCRRGRGARDRAAGRRDHEPREQSRRDANYKTVSVDPGQGAFALVRFAPNATAADITKFLEDNKAVVVDGPKAGMYRIRLAVTGMPKEELARIIKQMQDNKSVGFVAPVQ